MSEQRHINEAFRILSKSGVSEKVTDANLLYEIAEQFASIIDINVQLANKNKELESKLYAKERDIDKALKILNGEWD